MICFVLITLLFLDFTGTLHGWFGWLAKIQFLPAVLALNVGVILFLVILTLVCGRIYCSVICPLGVFQDILAWLGRQPKNAGSFLTLILRPYLGCAMAYWVCLSLLWLPELVHWLLYLHPIVHTDVLPIIFSTYMAMGQQSACLSGWTGRQLCLLWNGCMVEKPADLYYCCRYFCCACCSGRTQRTNLL